jgi:hypothetical protein
VIRGLSLALGLTMLLLAAGPARADLDDYYYTYDEIYAELDSLQTLYPNWIRVDSIGHSYETQTAIWSAKVTSNVHLHEDKPTVWVNGQCHAEEILGINVSMALIREMVAKGSIGHPDWGPLIENIELHVVPSNNPDGLGVVMSGYDRTFRKNLRSFADDGHCHIVPGIGGDSCGVDLNRNYPAWWHHGDELWEVNNDPEQFDYFRGPYPFSEPECACIGEQVERERFCVGVAYHSARTSTNQEIIIYPWGFGNDEVSHPCPAPDFEMMTALTRNMGDRIRGTIHEYYRNIAARKPRGNEHEWIYSHYGAVGLLVEVGGQGQTGMQPENQEIIDFIVEENLKGMNWLLRRVIGYEVAAPALWARVADTDGQPLEARLALDEVAHPDCVPYYRTDPVHGAYYRLLRPQPYTVRLRKHGYAPLNAQVNVGALLPTQRSWQLEALPRHGVSIAFSDFASGTPVPARRVELHDTVSDTLLVFPGPGVQAQLPEGVYNLLAFVDDHIAVRQTLVVDGPEDWTLPAVPLQDGHPYINRLFEDIAEFSATGQTCGWIESWNDSLGLHFKDTEGEWSAPNQNCRLALASDVQLEAPLRSLQPGALAFTALIRTEGARDTAFVEFSRDGGASWEPQLAFTGSLHQLREFSLPIGAEWAGPFRFGFRVKTDNLIEETGFLVGDIRLQWNPDALSVPEPQRPQAFDLRVAPNPFNPTTRLLLTLPTRAAGARVEVSLHDLLGRQVRALPPRENLGAGLTAIPLEAGELASGVYFARVRVLQGGRLLWDEAQRLTVIR